MWSDSRVELGLGDGPRHRIQVAPVERSSVICHRHRSFSNEQRSKSEQKITCHKYKYNVEVLTVRQPIMVIGQ